MTSPFCPKSDIMDTTRQIVCLQRHWNLASKVITNSNKTSGVKNFACFAFIPDKAASPANLLSIIPLGNSPFCVLALVSVLYCKRKFITLEPILTLFHDRLSYQNSRERTVSGNGGYPLGRVILAKVNSPRYFPRL